MLKTNLTHIFRLNNDILMFKMIFSMLIILSCMRQRVNDHTETDHLQ